MDRLNRDCYVVDFCTAHPGAEAVQVAALGAGRAGRGPDPVSGTERTERTDRRHHVATPDGEGTLR